MEVTMRGRFASLILIASSAALCAQGPPAWRIRDTPSALRPVLARADLVIAAMHDAVIRELSASMAEGGPETAITSAHIESALMTQRLAREGVAAGRTSDRLRNPTNLAPPWAAAIVKANAGQRARDVDGFSVDLGDTLGVIRPVVERGICANCHGPAERLSPTVRAVLSERYPADKAVGFAEGEIRGWFWVEMPKRPR
jgi:hypothetical protein